MIKKIVTFVLLLSLSSLYAEDKANSLVGFEMGYGSMNVSGPKYNKDKSVLTSGIKIGAKDRDARLFLSLRYLHIPDFDFSMAYGAELQYLKTISDKFNIFLGVNGGMINLNFDAHNFNKTATAASRSINTYYGGADTGINIYMTQSLGLELGMRYMYLDASKRKNGETYSVKPITQGYLSLIYRYAASK